MKETYVRHLLSLVLAVFIMVSSIPLYVHAQNNDEINYSDSSDIINETIEDEDTVAEQPVINDSETLEETDSVPENYNDAVIQILSEEVAEPTFLTETGITSLDSLVALAAKTTEASISKNNNEITVDPGGLILISNYDFSYNDYTISLTNIGGSYYDLTKILEIEGEQYSFQGLGSKNNPFSGKLKNQAGSFSVIVNVPFFKYVNLANATFENVSSFNIKTSVDSPERTTLFIEKATGTSGDSWSSLPIVLEGNTVNDVFYFPGELIDTLEQNSSLSIGNVTYSNGAKVSNTLSNSGLLCNTMKAGSTLSIDSLSVAGDISIVSSNGSAGGLVGLMEDGSSLLVNNGNVSNLSIGSNFTVTGQSAGGIIGSGTNIILNAKATIDKATISGGQAAGGLIGHYSSGNKESGLVSYDGSDSSVLKVNETALQTEIDGVYAGGIFGILELHTDFTISNTSVISRISGKKAYYGGIVGQVKGDPSENLKSLTVNGNTSPSTTATVDLKGFGGAFSVIGDENPVYIKTEGEFAPSFSGVNKLTSGNYFGGVAAYLKNYSVLETMGNISIFCNNIAGGKGYGGGILGSAERGATLCLGGTTNLSGMLFNSGNISYYTGQIVGYQESALIYAKPEWILIRQSEAQQVDDIGNYGEVIRLGGNIGMGTPATVSGLSSDLILQDENSHKTKFNDLAKLSLNNNNFEVGHVDQLALIAIEEQTKCAFEIYGSEEAYYFSQADNKTKGITLTSNISLEHTGIIGVQRDVDVGYGFDGTFDGGGHTLTVSIGEIYGYRGNTSSPASESTAGSGQIHRHAQVGFFSQANGTMKNLTVNGNINVYFGADEYIVGGLVARCTWNGGYENVTTNVNIAYQGSTSGYVGGLLGRITGKGQNMTISDCTGHATINIGSSGAYAGGLIGDYNSTAGLAVSNVDLKGTVNSGVSENARVGGLVSRIGYGNYDSVNVALTDINIDGQKIISASNGSCGGLLGYEWNNASVTFGDKENHNHGVVVKGDSEVSNTGNADGAGLVYAATGYWQLNDIRLEKLKINSGTRDFGLLIYRGWRINSTGAKPYLLYLEETNYQAYDIVTNGIEITKSGGYFDEWVIYTCYSAEDIKSNGNSVISIATPDATTDGDKIIGNRVGVNPKSNVCTSYQNRTEYGKTAQPNPKARYYYDLDLIRNVTTDGDSFISSPAELVLWSVWRYAKETKGTESNIANYFKTKDIASGPISGKEDTVIDLTGYSYYPVTVNGDSLSITNLKVKFSNKVIEEAETLRDSSSRVTYGTDNSHSQHYLMHSGLLLNYQNSGTSNDITLTLRNASFRGTIGKGPNGGSGALVCGVVGDNVDASSPKYTKISITNLVLDGASVNADKTASDYAPLLINNIGSYSSLSVQELSVNSVNYVGITSTKPAATSLIGNVGSESAINISLAFDNGIGLNGKPESSIFSHATLLESFQYQSGGSGYYHFNKNEQLQTYGYEINHSAEFEEFQGNYYDQSGKVEDGQTKDFENYLPYVCNKHLGESNSFHEIEINVPSPDLTAGCGTYDDPYIINSVRQLMYTADFINGNTPQNGWKVNKVGENAESQSLHHKEYIVGITGWDDDSMRTYMCSAYYKLSETIGGLDFKSFSGFGTLEKPFTGVIDGNGKTISINSVGSGLINVSYGSVVRDIIINYNGSKTMTGTMPDNSNNSHVAYADSFFGGIIGTVLGGDNLIENVVVNFLENFKINTSYDLQCAGGFIGLVQGGGVILRNMDSKMDGVLVNKGFTEENIEENAKNKYYVDTYVGRVLDGYIINEVDSSLTGASSTFAANTGKNYSIPDISVDGTIDWNNGNIAISNEQQMIILSSIIDSGSANGGSSSAYHSGSAKTRNGDYSKIGKTTDTGFEDARTSAHDDDTKLGADNYPYLIKKYGGNNSAFWTTCTGATGLSITFSANKTLDLSIYGNGYRGIGGRYNCNANDGKNTYNTPLIVSVTGNNNPIYVNNNLNEYKSDNFHINSAGGLFNTLRHNGADIKLLNIYGDIKVSSGIGEASDKESDDYLTKGPVGGLIGQSQSSNDSTLRFTNVSFGNSSTTSTVYGESVSGGFIGSSGSKKTATLEVYASNKTVTTFENCYYQKANITGGICTGGFIGSAVYNSGYYANFSESNTTSNLSSIKWTDSQICGGSDSTINNLFCASGDTTTNGVGGVIGFCSIPFEITGVESSKTIFNNIELYGGKENKRGRIGGLVGFIVNNITTRSISNIKLTNMTVGANKNRYSSTYDDNAGIIVGTWYAQGTMTVSDCLIENSSVQANSSGGILGYGGNGGNFVVRDIEMNNITFPKRGGNNVGAIGGQIIKNFYAQNILIKNLDFSDTDVGRLFGTGTLARVLGVTIQQNNGKALPNKDIYNTAYSNYGTTNYVVYAGYESNEIITSPGDISINPSMTISGINQLHGDTINPEKINLAANDATLYQNMKNAGVNTRFAVNVSDYNSNQDKKLLNEYNFPVVLIDGDASVLKKYLNVATNGGFSSAVACSKVSVNRERYVYNDSEEKFILANSTEYPDTLNYNSSTGEFSATVHYDNQKGTFTLVTVTFKGYSNTDTFVLHIPVIVRRMLQVDFVATMTSGTVFNINDDFYEFTRNHALASAGENITGYLSFLYNSNSSDVANPATYDWQSYMEAGGDLLGYYEKRIDTGNDGLPAGTMITLIDCQNGYKRYSTQLEGSSRKLELFNSDNLKFIDSGGIEFVPKSLADLLKVCAAEYDENNSVKWVRSETNATVKATDGFYYRIYDAQKDSNVTEFYSLTVTIPNPREDYFVVINVPDEKNYRLTLDKNGMSWSDKNPSPPVQVHQVHRYDNRISEPKNGNSEASFNYLNNYSQNLDDLVSAENVSVQVTGAKMEIPVSIKNTVTFTKANYNENDPLYQEFVISLSKTEEGVTSNVGFPSDAVATTKVNGETIKDNAVKIYAYYEDNAGIKHYYVWNGSGLVEERERKAAVSYSWSGDADSAKMVLPFGVKTKDGYQYVDLAVLREASNGIFYLEAETTIEMSVASILSNNIVPYNSVSENIVNYTNINCVSVLSFTQTGLSYSTLQDNADGKKRYYLITERNAVLKLDYVNIDQLGINMYEDKEAVIDAVLSLDLSNMEGFTSNVQDFRLLSESDAVRFTISLKKKNESMVYDDAGIGSYISHINNNDVSDSETYSFVLEKDSQGNYPYYNEQTGRFVISLSFVIDTSVKEYANYRINADVELLKDEEVQALNVNTSEAYLTYAYAKVNVNGYWETADGS